MFGFIETPIGLNLKRIFRVYSELARG